MTMQVPISTPYAGTITPVPSRLLNIPAEGNMQASLAIAWSAGAAFSINMNQFGPQPWSQIASAYVDNTQCDADVTFYLIPTGTTVTVPANTQGLFLLPCISSTFTIGSALASEADTTSIVIFNFVPPAMAVAETQIASTATIAAVTLAANATTAVVPAGTYGVLTGFSISACDFLPVASDTGEATIALIDGEGNVVWIGEISGISSNTTIFIPVVTVTGIVVPFQNGLGLRISGSLNVSTGVCDCTVWVR